MKTARHKVPRPRQGERDAGGWRGERQAYPAPGEGGRGRKRKKENLLIEYRP